MFELWLIFSSLSDQNLVRMDPENYGVNLILLAGKSWPNPLVGDIYMNSADGLHG